MWPAARRACLIALVASAGCSSPPFAAPLDGGAVGGLDDGSAGGPGDGGAGGPDAPGGTPDDAARPGVDARALIDAPVAVPDAPVEATDLAVICGHAPVTLDDWEACYQQRVCEWQVGCQGGGAFRDVQDCIASGDAVSGGRLGAERRARERAVAAGTAAIDPEAFQRCLIGTSAVHCNTALFDENCLTRFTGTVGDGGTCSTDAECASRGAVCQSGCGDACCAGTCQPRPAEGEACPAYETCAPGLVCGLPLKGADHGICESGDLGAACRDDSDCDLDKWCDATSGRCRATFPIGAECVSLLQCGDDASCVGTSISDTAPGHCAQISRPGDPCDFMCYGNLYCSGSGRCRSLPVLGQSCSALTPCAGADVVCNSGLCVVRSDVGAVCSGDTCLPGLFCTSALGDPHPTCAARRAAGATCNDPGQCESYACSGDEQQAGVCQSCP